MRTLLLLCLLAVLAGCSSGTPPQPTPVDRQTEPAPRAPERRDALPVTGPPGLAYVEGSLLRHPDGRTVRLPRGRGYTGIVEYAGGYLVADDRAFEGTVGMQRLDATGRVLDRWAGTGSPLSGDGTVAWVSLAVAESGQAGPTLLHRDRREGGAEVTQEVDPTRVPFLTGWFRGRLVYETWGDAASYVTDLVHPPRAVPRAEDLGTPGPDGAYSARQRPRGIEVLHADGQLARLVRHQGLGLTAAAPAWEDERHLLATVTRGDRMCVARIDVRSGTVSRATPWRPATYAGFAFVPRPGSG